MQRRDIRVVVMGLSLAASVLMLGGKLFAYWLTASAAIFADAAESLVHGVATGFAAFALWYADRPADEDHLYGHGKIVYFSAGFEGALILIAALTVVVSSVRALIWPPELQRLGWGIAITVGLGLLNLALGTALVQVGKQRRALVLVANGKHVLSDVWTSLGAVIGLLLVTWTGLRWLDPLAGLLIGAQIAYTAVSLLRRSFTGLMDRSDPRWTQALIEALQGAVGDCKLVGFHQLRQRVVNDQLWVEVHLLVPGDISAEEAHRVATCVEQRMQQAIPDAAVQVTSHIEPAAHGRAHPDGHARPDPALQRVRESLSET